jgi:hypothetical protein
VTFKELLMMMTMLELVIDRTGTGTGNVPFPEFGGFVGSRDHNSNNVGEAFNGTGTGTG